VEHIAVGHEKLGRYLPLAVWNRLKLHGRRRRRSINNVDHQSDAASTAAQLDASVRSSATDGDGDQSDPAITAAQLDASVPPPAATCDDAGGDKVNKPRGGKTTGESSQPEILFTCYICRRGFASATKLRQHYTMSHFAHQMLGRFTASRLLSSPVKEQCLYCPHVALPKHLLEHVRQVESERNLFKAITPPPAPEPLSK
jgi:hypothetical protein